MGSILAVLGVVLAVSTVKLSSETSAEFFAKYLSDQENIGVSTEEPTSVPLTVVAPPPASEPSGPAAEPVPVLMAAVEEPVGSPVARSAVPTAPARDGGMERIIPAAATVSGPAGRGPEAGGKPATDAAPAGPGSATAEVSDPLLSLIGDTPHRRPDGTVFMPIAAQHVFGLRTVIGQRTAMPATVELPGRIVTNPSTAHLIQSGQEGFVEIAGGQFPYAGQRVQRGDLLGYLRPALTTLEKAQIESQAQDLVNDIDLARKRMTRLEEVLMIRYRANRIEQMRIEIEGMRRQLEVLRTSVDRPIELRAQTDGVVSRVNAASGQFVHAGHTIFEIVDPTRLWVSASAFEPDVQERLVSATALTADGRRLDLQFVGGGLALNQQALPLHFEIVDGRGNLTVDTPVTVVVQLEGKAATGLRVPRGAVTRTSDGRELIWERRSAEQFVAHHVTVTPIDADSVLVTSPIASSARIVTAGVSTLGQIQ